MGKGELFYGRVIEYSIPHDFQDSGLLGEKNRIGIERTPSQSILLQLIFIYIYVYMCKCTCVYICMYVCMDVYIYIYVYI